MYFTFRWQQIHKCGVVRRRSSSLIQSHIYFAYPWFISLQIAFLLHQVQGAVWSNPHANSPPPQPPRRHRSISYFHTAPLNRTLGVNTLNLGARFSPLTPATMRERVKTGVWMCGEAQREHTREIGEREITRPNNERGRCWHCLLGLLLVSFID